MKNSKNSRFILVKTIVLTLILILILKVTLACPSSLECSNFTNSKKILDCNYIETSNFLTYHEKQEILCEIWDQDYHYESYQNEPSEILEINFSLSQNKLTESRFILVGKILILVFFNYITISIIKLSVKTRWNVGY